MKNSKPFVPHKAWCAVGHDVEVARTVLSRAICGQELLRKPQEAFVHSASSGQRVVAWQAQEISWHLLLFQ